METNRDFRDLLFELNAADARYLVVGGYAVAFHGRPRFTKDLDLLIEATPDNARRVFLALSCYGAPSGSLIEEDLTNPSMVFQIGVPPNRIDILTEITAVDFAAAWSRRVEGVYGDCKVAFLAIPDLIANKRAVGRPQDLQDVAMLERRKGSS